MQLENWKKHLHLTELIVTEHAGVQWLRRSSSEGAFAAITSEGLVTIGREPGALLRLILNAATGLPCLSDRQRAQALDTLRERVTRTFLNHLSTQTLNWTLPSVEGHSKQPGSLSQERLTAEYLHSRAQQAINTLTADGTLNGGTLNATPQTQALEGALELGLKDLEWLDAKSWSHSPLLKALSGHGLSDDYVRGLYQGLTLAKTSQPRALNNTHSRVPTPQGPEDKVLLEALLKGCRPEARQALSSHAPTTWQRPEQLPSLLATANLGRLKLKLFSNANGRPDVEVNTASTSVSSVLNDLLDPQLSGAASEAFVPAPGTLDTEGLRRLLSNWSSPSSQIAREESVVQTLVGGAERFSAQQAGQQLKEEPAWAALLLEADQWIKSLSQEAEHSLDEQRAQMLDEGASWHALDKALGTAQSVAELNALVRALEQNPGLLWLQGIKDDELQSMWNKTFAPLGLNRQHSLWGEFQQPQRTGWEARVTGARTPLELRTELESGAGRPTHGAQTLTAQLLASGLGSELGELLSTTGAQKKGGPGSADEAHKEHEEQGNTTAPEAGAAQGLFINGQLVPGTEWLRAKDHRPGQPQPSWDGFTGPYALHEYFETSPENSTWACDTIEEVVASVKDTTQNWDGDAVYYSVSGPIGGAASLWIQDEDGECWIQINGSRKNTAGSATN